MSRRTVSSASVAGTSGVTPTPSQFVSVIGLTDAATR
jgi:hypothetical protein